MKTIKKIMMGLAAVVGFTTAAMAATPVAVWDGDFKTTTKGSYTLTTGTGHTVAEDGSTITIGDTATAGVKVSGGDIYTIVVKARGYTPTSTSNPEVIAAMLNSDNNSKMGLGSKSDKKGWYIWNNGAWGDTHVTSSAIINDTNSHKYTVSYANPATGSITQDTTMFMDNTQLAAETGLRDQYLAKATAATIGGPQSGTGLTVAKGLVIEGIAIFDSTVSTAEAAKYHFPSSPLRTISINFGSGQGSVSGTYGIVPSSSWNNYSEGSFNSSAKAANVSDGSTVSVKWWSSGIYQYTSVTDAALKGYLDDAGCGDGTTGQGAHIAITGIPFAYYDVIVYHATDSSGYAFNPAAFKKWTQQSKCGQMSDSQDGTKRLARNNANLKFGTSRNATAVIGTNVSYIKRCFSFTDLDIKAGGNANTARGGIAAIQIVECDPHGSEMYFNRLAGDSVTVPAGTYGNITTLVPIKATQYTGSAPTALTLSGSTTEIGGDAQYIQGYHTNTRTHSMSGWFRCDGLDSEKMLYAAIAYKGSDGGYKVTVDANGAINVGKCNYYGWNGTALKSSNGVIEANKWYYITVAVTAAEKDDAATATARVFVNGAEITFGTGTFATNLNGSDKTIELSIGQGVSAAGLYADFSAIGDAGLSASLATNPKYVAFKGTDYTLNMTKDETSSTSTAWDPEREGAFIVSDTITVNDTADSAVTLTFDENADVKKISATSEAGKELTLAKGEGKSVSAAEGFDFSGANGKVTVGFDTGAAAVTAGSDTVLNGAGTGTLTIGTDKQATVRNWSGSNLSGAGKVVYNAEAAETAVAPGAFASGFTGSIKLTQGTWTCSDNYPKTIPVTLSGANAKFILNKQDGMGYDSGLPAFTVENGATFEVDKRDTFNRTLALKNGGKFVCKQDNNDSGRSFDFYGTSAITVDGTCTIGGLTAESTSNSGILAIRRSDFTVTVNSGAELQCYSAWSTAASSGGNFKKAGDGKMVQYRDSDCALPFVVDAGTLKFVNGGRTTTAGITLSDGMKLELSATGDGSYTLANAISGAGRIEKLDGGTYILSGASDFTGGTTISAGTLKLANNDQSRLGTGNYTVAEGATLDLTTRRPDAKMATSAGTICVTLSSSEQAQFDAGNQIEIFDAVDGATLGALRVFDANDNEYLNTFVVEGGKVKATKVEQKTPPFTVTNPVSEVWTTAGWMDSSETPKSVVSDDWAIKVGANLTVNDANTYALTADRVIQLGTFNVANAGALTVTATDNAITADTIDIANAGTFTISGAGVGAPTTIDDSDSTGTTTLDFETHAANITVGANTIVRGGGTGTLTIGADKKATINNGVWAGTVTRDNASTIRYAGTAGTTSVPYVDGDSNTGLVIYAADFGNLGDNGLQFKNTLTRKFENGFIVTGGRFVTGNQANHTQNFTMDGGSITVTGNAGPTSSSASTLFAHWNSTVNFTMNGGTLTAENAAARLGWDGKAYVTVAGGTFRTKGIKSGDDRNNDASFTLSGGTLELGDFGIVGAGSKAPYTFSGGTVRAYANTSISVAHASGLQVTGNVTFDVGTYTLTLPGKVSGSGNITVTGTGTLILSGDASSYTGVLTVPAGMTVKANESWLTGGRLSFADTTCNLVMYDKTSYDGRFTMTLADGSATPANITVKSSADESHDYGTVTVTGTAPNVTVSYTPWVDGKGALYAWEFNGSLASTGRTSSDMGKDHGPYYTDDNERIYAYSQPYNGLSWPTEFTTAIACTLPTNANVCLVGWGQATPGGIALTSGDIAKHEVKMVYWQNNQHYTELATMTVPNAFDSEHLYLFTKTADGVKVYLDGSLVVNYSGALSLGVGVQVGTVYQGVGNTGLVRLDTVYSSTSECKSAVNTLRIYDAVLGPNSIAELKAEFPYTSPKGTYTRALTGTENAWNETDKWTRTKTGEEPSLVSVPAADATVVLTAKDAATIANNLAAPVAYEAINLSGEGTITITAADDNTNKITSAGNVQIGANAVVKYSAIDLGNTPIEIMTGKKLTIDASMIDVTKYFTTTAIPLTGLVTAADDESTQLEITPPTAAAGSGRTVSVAKNGSTHFWEVTITVEPKPFVYTVAQGSEPGVWAWGSQEVTAEQVAAQTTGEIQKAGAGTATLTPQAGMTYTVNTDGGTLKFGSELVRGMNVTVNQGGIFDLNGLKAKEMNLTLAGGKVTNSSSETLSEGDQIKTITLTASSEINVPNAYQVYAESYNTPTTIALGEFTLTKTGSAQLKLVNTDITGTGTFLVNEGSIFNGEDARFAEGVTLSIGASGTWEQRDGNRNTFVSKVSGTEGGTLNVAGKISGFELSGTLNLTGNGTYGTITNAAQAVAKVGNRRNLTFAGAGTVDVTMTAAEYAPGAEITAFTLASTEPASTTTVGKIFYPAGTEVTSKAYIEGNKITIKKEAKIGSTYYIVLADALDAAEANATVTLCTNVTMTAAYTLGKNLTLDGDNYVINGSGFTGSGKLTIAAGFIGVTNLPESYSLIGGKYTSNSKWQAETGYHYVVIANTGDMLYQIVKSGDTPAPEDEKAYVVTGGTIAASESDLVSKGYITQGQDVQTFLNTNGDNGIPNWKNVTLGLSNTVATDIPYPAPVQSAEANKVSLKLGSNVVVDKGSGATVTYKVKTRTGSEWTTLPDEYGYGDTAEVALPDTGVKYYKFDVIVTPAK